MKNRTANFPYSLPTVLMLTVVAVFITGAVAGACDSDSMSDENDGNAESLVPIETGNSWTADSDTNTHRITDNTEEIDGETYREVEPLSEGFKHPYVRESNKDLIVGYKQGDIPITTFRFKYPVDEGDSFTHVDERGTTREVEVEVRDVSVSAGSFEDCMCYNIITPDNEFVERLSGEAI